MTKYRLLAMVLGLLLSGIVTADSVGTQTANAGIILGDDGGDGDGGDGDGTPPEETPPLDSDNSNPPPP